MDGKYKRPALRRIGDKAQCAICGAEYVVTSPKVKYCEICRTTKKGQIFAKNLKNAYDRMEIRIPKGEKQTYVDHAESMNESLNQFLARAVKNQLAIDSDFKTQITNNGPCSVNISTAPNGSCLFCGSEYNIHTVSISKTNRSGDDTNIISFDICNKCKHELCGGLMTPDSDAE